MTIKDQNGLITSTVPEILGDGSVLAGWAEGPVWLPEEHKLLFSDIHGSRVLQWDEYTNKISVRVPDSDFSNGRTTGLNGEVIQCSHGKRCLQLLTGDKVEPVVETWKGHRFNSPNDVIVKSDGSIWFSDPAYGICRPGEGHEGEMEYGDQWVFRYDPATREVSPVITDVEIPNGLAFSPDEKLLYSSDNSIDLPSRKPNPEGTHAIRVYKVVDGKFCKGGRHFVTIESGIADGIRVDEFGNVWSCEFNGIHVYSPSREEIAFIPTPEEHIGNMCFGGSDGRDVFFLAGHQPYRIRTTVRDASHTLRGTYR